MSPPKIPEEADLLLLNTCSVREKAQEKVFSQLGRWRELKAARPHVIIGVGGCVASQEGFGITDRAPFVDLVFGPQTIHRLPDMLAQLRAKGRSVVDVSFPEIEKFDRLPAPRAEGATAFVSIMEGCSKYCTFCVVPVHARRGSEPAARAGHDGGPLPGGAGRRRSHPARPERQRLPRRDDRRRPCGSRGADLLCRGGAGRRAYPLHDLAPGRIPRQPHRGLPRPAAARQLPAPAGAERLGPRAGADEARPHGARVQAEDPQAAGSPTGHQPLDRPDRRLPRGDRTRFPGHARPRARHRLRPEFQLHLQPAPRYAGGRPARRSDARGEAGAARAAAGAAQRPGAGDQPAHGRHGAARAGRTPCKAGRAPARRPHREQPLGQFRRPGHAAQPVRRGRDHRGHAQFAARPAGEHANAPRSSA